jgi:hypothetical protein
MHLEYTLQKNDYVIFSRLMATIRHHFDFAVLKILAFSLLVMLLFHLSGGLNPRKLPRQMLMYPLTQVEALIYSFIFILSTLFISVLLYFSSKSNYRKIINHAGKRVTLTITDDHVYFDVADNNERHRWKEISAIVLDRFAIYLVNNKKNKNQQPIIIPRHIFKNEFDYLNAINLIQKKSASMQQRKLA